MGFFILRLLAWSLITMKKEEPTALFLWATLCDDDK
jgi:hypothetical protein